MAEPHIEAVTKPVTVGESPHWAHDEQALYFVSIFDHSVHRYVPATGKQTSSKLDGPISFIVPIEGKPSRFVVGNKRKVIEIEWKGEDDGAKIVRTVVEVDQNKPSNMFSDGKADPRGRLFAGTFDFGGGLGNFGPKGGSLFRLDHNGTLHTLDTGIDVSNGMCWDLNAKAFYFTDSLEYAIRRYDYDVDTGNISNPKRIFDYKEQGLEGFADGMTIDTEGNLWVASFNGHEVLKIDPKSGLLLQKVQMPVSQVTAVTFGGPSLSTLFVTTAAAGDDPEPSSGSTFTVTGLEARGYPPVLCKLNNT